MKKIASYKFLNKLKLTYSWGFCCENSPPPPEFPFENKLGPPLVLPLENGPLVLLINTGNNIFDEIYLFEVNSPVPVELLLKRLLLDIALLP